MRRFRRYAKKIACLEGQWEEWTHRSTVLPFLQALEAWSETKSLFTHHTCNTRGELQYHVERLARHKSFDLVYLAFHGSPGCVEVGTDSLTLDELAIAFGTGLSERVVHFASCSTLDVDARHIRRFLRNTGVKMVSGYTSDVWWPEAAAFEYLYFDLWQDYVDPRAFEKRLQSLHGQLIKRLAFRCVS